MKTHFVFGPFFLALLLAFHAAFANYAQTTDDWIEEDLPSLDPTPPKSLLKTGHTVVSSSIGGFSDSIDDFFADPRMDFESNGTRLRLKLLSQLTNKEPTIYNNSVNFHLDLPKSKKRWNLIIVSFSRDLTENDERAQQSASPRESVANQDYFAGLRYFTKKTRNFNVSTDAGIKLVWPPDPFARIRLRESIFIGNWEYRFTQSLFWFESRGTGANAGIDFDRPINRAVLFRFANQAAWLEDENLTNFVHSLNVFHSVTDKDGFAYSTGINSTANPTPILDSYYISTRYRRAIYKNAFFGEIQPIGTWPRNREFSFRPGVIFSLELTMGPNYM
jgi:hypothetical protein